MNLNKFSITKLPSLPMHKHNFSSRIIHQSQNKSHNRIQQKPKQTQKKHQMNRQDRQQAKIPSIKKVVYHL
jgi:hypothetical protein